MSSKHIQYYSVLCGFRFFGSVCGFNLDRFGFENPWEHRTQPLPLFDLLLVQIYIRKQVSHNWMMQKKFSYVLALL